MFELERKKSNISPHSFTREEMVSLLLMFEERLINIFEKMFDSKFDETEKDEYLTKAKNKYNMMDDDSLIRQVHYLFNFENLTAAEYENKVSICKNILYGKKKGLII